MSVRASHSPPAPSWILVLAACLAAGALPGCQGGPGSSSAPSDADRPNLGPERAAVDASSLPGAPSSACPLDADRLYIEGIVLLEEGSLEGAWRSLRCAAFLRPLHEPSMRALADAASRLYETLLEEALALLERGRVIAACERLRLATRVEPLEEGPFEAEVLLARHGHELYGSEWIPRDDAILREKREARIAEVRRRELGLGTELSLHRKRDVRVFTDVGEEIFAARIHRLVDELRFAHASLFVPLGIDLAGPPGPGLDVVIYSRREDYERRTGSTTTLGMFLPDVRASFFFFRPGSIEQNVPVLFHEVCHQLDDRLLGMRVPPPWLREGLAVLFETARVGADGRIESWGEISPDAARRIRAMAASGGRGTPEGTLQGTAQETLQGTLQSTGAEGSLSSEGSRWWSLERLVGTETLAGLHGTDAVHDFYVQASLLVGFLVSGRDVTREIFYEIVERARRPGARPARAWQDFREVLELRGRTPEAIEAMWRDAAAELAEELGGGLAGEPAGEG